MEGSDFACGWGIGRACGVVRVGGVRVVRVANLSCPMSTTRAVLKLHDMPAEMLDFAINTAAYAQARASYHEETHF